jgi:hypothetical protein
MIVVAVKYMIFREISSTVNVLKGPKDGGKFSSVSPIIKPIGSKQFVRESQLTNATFQSLFFAGVS